MKQTKPNTVEQIISEQMRKASLALTPEKRKANGEKSWKTRRSNPHGAK